MLDTRPDALTWFMLDTRPRCLDMAMLPMLRTYVTPPPCISRLHRVDLVYPSSAFNNRTCGLRVLLPLQHQTPQPHFLLLQDGFSYKRRKIFGMLLN